MSDETFRHFRCWNTPEVQQTVFGDIASLGLDADAVFLAAHTSLNIEHVQGVQQAGAEREVAVLRALDSGFGVLGQNTVIAVTGPSGSGKSHLVRWVRAQLSDDASSYHLIYVPKALETLRQLLGHILDRMPGPESEAVHAELAKAIGKKRPEQLADELLDRMRSVLGYELPMSRQGHDNDVRAYLLGTLIDGETTRREGGLADLLLCKPIRDHFLRPAGAISRMVDSVRDKRGGESETPEFDASDWPTRQAGIASQLSPALRGLWTSIGRDPGPALALLNESRNLAVAEALGMRAGVNLGEVFAKTRRRLRQEGKELVLLFEDLAQFGLFDGDLYDHFAIQPGDELAPIRALFAITDGKFVENVPDTVRTRLAHHFRVGELTRGGGDSEDDTSRVVARYLNVARVGRQRLIAGWTEASAIERESGAWVPNACLDRLGDGRECVHREICWASFGTINEVGLYPYNQVALRRELQKRGPTVTARSLVDGTVKEFLIEADTSIGSGLFPSENTRARFDFSVSRAKETIVPGGALSDHERDRLHRCRVIWADGGVENDGITLAFDLPSLEGTEAPPTRPEVVITVKPAATESPLVPLFAWQNGEEMPEVEAIWYRERLLDLVRARLDVPPMLIDPGQGPGQVVLGKVLSANSFELGHAPGRAAGQRLRFPILPNDAGVLLLSAVRWWWDHGHWDTTDDQRKWDFPLDPTEAQIAFEEFLDRAVLDTEGAVVALLLRGTIEPVAAALGLRTAALLAVGKAPPPNINAESLNWVLTSPTAQSIKPSATWSAVAAESLSTLNDVDARWLSAFASARQGDTGEPLCVDAARLVPVIRDALTDALGLLDRSPGFDDSFSEIAMHWDALRHELTVNVTEEAEGLRQTLAEIGDLRSDDFAGLVDAVESAGVLAGDAAMFRPQSQYASFKRACDRLRQTSGAEVDSLLQAGPQLGSTDRTEITDAVMKAQRWAPTARNLREDLEVVNSCLSATAAELSERVVDDLGATPETAAALARGRLEELSKQLSALYHEGRQ